MAAARLPPSFALKVVRVPSVSIQTHFSSERVLGGSLVWLWIVFLSPDAHACGSLFDASIFEPRISRIHTDESQT